MKFVKTGTASTHRIIIKKIIDLHKLLPSLSLSAAVFAKVEAAETKLISGNTA